MTDKSSVEQSVSPSEASAGNSGLDAVYYSPTPDVDGIIARLEEGFAYTDTLSATNKAAFEQMRVLRFREHGYLLKQAAALLRSQAALITSRTGEREELVGALKELVSIRDWMIEVGHGCEGPMPQALLMEAAERQAVAIPRARAAISKAKGLSNG